MIDRNRFISEFEEILTDTEYKEQSFMEAKNVDCHRFIV